MNLASDTSLGICKSMGLELISLSEAYERLKPDMVLLLGDRYEIFTAASAALICKIPIAHIHSGEITRGAYDDSMRHAISKMSYLHFTSTREYRKRVIQLGEAPDRVHWVGALGIENMKTIKLLTRQELEEKLKLSLDPPMALVTFHPATLDHDSAPVQFQPLEEALLHFPDLFTVFTKSNSDTGGNQIKELASDEASSNDVILHVIDGLRHLGKTFDCFMLLQPTSPLRNEKHIIESADVLLENNADSVVSICKSDSSSCLTVELTGEGRVKALFSDKKQVRRQDLPPEYRINGAIYLALTSYFVKHKSFYEGETLPYFMNAFDSIDIDDGFQMKIAELLLLDKNLSNPS
jgi:CMP-N-acetylneuraminic acid synthetase